MRVHVRDGERSQGEKAPARTNFLPVLSLADFTRGLIAFHSLSLPLFSTLPECRCVISRAIDADLPTLSALP